jgi:hypothetical protein
VPNRPSKALRPAIKRPCARNRRPIVEPETGIYPGCNLPSKRSFPVVSPTSVGWSRERPQRRIWFASSGRSRQYRKAIGGRSPCSDAPASDLARGISQAMENAPVQICTESESTARQGHAPPKKILKLCMRIVVTGYLRAGAAIINYTYLYF